MSSADIEAASSIMKEKLEAFKAAEKEAERAQGPLDELMRDQFCSGVPWDELSETQKADFHRVSEALDKARERRRAAWLAWHEAVVGFIEAAKRDLADY